MLATLLCASGAGERVQADVWASLSQAFVSPYSTVLRSVFSSKKEEKIQELMEAAGWHPNSSNADLLHYHSLFTEVGGWVGVQELG